MWLERISGGGDDLVSLAAAKEYLRILSDETDAEVQAAISAASAHLDVDADGFGGLGFPLISQQWVTRAACFGKGVLRLPFSYIAAIDEISFIVPGGQSSIVPAQDYRLVKSGRQWVVVLVSGRSWPDLDDRPDAVEIRFTAGWPALGDVPADIVDAAKVLTAHFFHARGGSVEIGVSEEISRCVNRLTARYRRFAM